MNCPLAASYSGSGGPPRTCGFTVPAASGCDHPVVGQLDLDFEAMELPSEPGLQLNVYTAAANTPTADGLKLLASWAASQESLLSERFSGTAE